MRHHEAGAYDQLDSDHATRGATERALLALLALETSIKAAEDPEAVRALLLLDPPALAVLRDVFKPELLS